MTSDNSYTIGLYCVSGVPTTSNNQPMDYQNIMPYNGSYIDITKPTRTSTIMPNTHCTGSKLRTSQVPNATSCQNTCIDDRNCRMWTFNNRNQKCSTRGKIQPCYQSDRYTSGYIIERPPTIPLAPAPPVSVPILPISPSVSAPILPFAPAPQPIRLLPVSESSRLRDAVFADVFDRRISADSASDCQNACLGNNNCGKWSYDRDKKLCMLYNANSNVIVPRSNAVSGEIYKRY